MQYLLYSLQENNQLLWQILLHDFCPHLLAGRFSILKINMKDTVLYITVHLTSVVAHALNRSECKKKSTLKSKSWPAGDCNSEH